MGTCHCISQSDKAICVIGMEVTKGIAEWIPQSQVHADSEVYKRGDTGELIITGYWAQQKGWI